jgi:hypothetical protein
MIVRPQRLPRRQHLLHRRMVSLPPLANLQWHNQRVKGAARESRPRTTWDTTTDRPFPSIPNNTARNPPRTPCPLTGRRLCTPRLRPPSGRKGVREPATVYTMKTPRWAKSASGPHGNRPAMNRNAESWRTRQRRFPTMFLPRSPSSRPRMFLCL